MTTDRRYVFISHANPEDNRFATWLAARLEAEGYQPWIDIDQFLGGEPVWSTIEEIIRDHAAIVISIMSNSSYKKPGVLDEMALAVTTRQRLASEVFLVPVRLDDLPFGDFPVQIVRLNAVDFAGGWAKGFRRLLGVLEDSQVPRVHPRKVSASWSDLLRDTEAPPVDSLLRHACSNWFPITSLPDDLILSRVTASQVDLPKINSSIAAPAVVRDRLVASFASTTELQACLATPAWLEHAYTIPLHAVFPRSSVGSDAITQFNLPFQRAYIRRIVVELLNKALASTLNTCGLEMYKTRYDQTWYVPAAWRPGDKISFSDVFGNRKWRKLVGKALQYHWHFGISYRCRLDSPIRFVLRPRVVFTTDGIRLANGKAIMNKLRKRHCRNWWNADWRDKLQALSAALAQGNEHISVLLGGNAVAQVNTHPMVYRLGPLSDTDNEVHKGEHAAIHELRHIQEPLLQFGHDQNIPHPRDGLFLFGPLAAKENPDSMRIGVIGTHTGLAGYRRWLREVKTGISSSIPERSHHRSWPGFEAVFDARWPDEPLVSIPIDADRLSAAIRHENRHKALYETVGLFAEPIQNHILQNEAPPSLWFVVVPDDVYKYGRNSATIPRSERIVSGGLPSAVALRNLRDGVYSLFPDDRKELEIYQYERNFHHQLKARLLQQRVVLQLVRESTLTPEHAKGRRGREDPATVAWNLCTTSFFKASGKPWKIASSRPGVCYVGLVYKLQDRYGHKTNACCGAQMFLDSGDGLVFRGAVGPWYSKTRKEFHLTQGCAADLMKLVVDAYQGAHGALPMELFIHGRTRFDDEEWKGFESVVSPSTKLVGVRLRPNTSEIRLFTDGTQAVPRGTVYAVNDRKGYLWTTGYTPYLGTYPGWEVPGPVLVDICRGKADLLTVMRDIMALTKLNFNSSVFADGQPVTLRFADAVGEILTAAPVNDLPPLPFRHYI